MMAMLFMTDSNTERTPTVPGTRMESEAVFLSILELLGFTDISPLNKTPKKNMTEQIEKVSPDRVLGMILLQMLLYEERRIDILHPAPVSPHLIPNISRE